MIPSFSFVTRERLDQMSETGKHQGVIAYAAAYEYAEVSDICKTAEEKGEPPFVFLLDSIEDPHNLGAIIRTANLAGAHGVIIPKAPCSRADSYCSKGFCRSVKLYSGSKGLPTWRSTIEELKKEGLWFVCADMGGEVMYRLNLTGPIGLVIGNEGNGVSNLIREKCDYDRIHSDERGY